MMSFGTAFNSLNILAPFPLTVACLLCVTGFGQVIGDNNASIGFSPDLDLWSYGNVFFLFLHSSDSVPYFVEFRIFHR